MTPEDVQEVAHKYIDPEHMILVAAGALDAHGKPLETTSATRRQIGIVSSVVNSSSNPLSVAKPELLAPAGDWDALRAAVAGGADAVYFGLSNFNARHRATNFSADELPQVMDYLHRRNVRGYVALNTLIFLRRIGRSGAACRGRSPRRAPMP